MLRQHELEFELVLAEEREQERRQAEAQLEEQRQCEREKAAKAKRAEELRREQEAAAFAQQQRLEEQRVIEANLKAQQEEAERQERVEEEARERVRANQAILAARTAKATDLSKVPLHQRPPASAVEVEELMALADGVERKEAGRRVPSDPKAAKLIGRTCVWSDKLMGTVRSGSADTQIRGDDEVCGREVAWGGAARAVGPD